MAMSSQACLLKISHRHTPKKLSLLKSLMKIVYNYTHQQNFHQGRRQYIFKALNKLKLDSSSGPDNLEPILLKKCSRAIIKPLHLLFNWSLSKGNYPKCWKASYILYNIYQYIKTGPKTTLKTTDLSVKCLQYLKYLNNFYIKKSRLY